MSYVFLFCSMFFAVIGQFLLKQGIMSQELSMNFRSIISAFFSIKVFFGFFLYGISSIFWLFVLKKLPLSVAYPSLSLTYIFVVILSVFILKEPFSIQKLFGIFFIFVGVCLLNINFK